VHRFLAELLIGVAALAIAWPIEHFFTRVLPKSGLDDPVYKKNVRRLIERNRKFEEESKQK
jgi:hypothetical protein